MDEDVRTAWVFISIHDLHPGDEHPTRKGWFLQHELGSRGEPMWLKPPSRVGVWVRRFALSAYWLMLIAGVTFALLGGV